MSIRFLPLLLLFSTAHAKLRAKNLTNPSTIGYGTIFNGTDTGILTSEPESAKMLNFKKLILVGTSHNFGTWDGIQIANHGNIWNLKWAERDPNTERIWCVGTDGNVGIWSGWDWDNQGLMGGWTLKMITWDKAGTMWCVGTGNNVGEWNGNGWNDRGHMGGWQMRSIQFDESGTLWGLGTYGNIGRWMQYGGWHDDDKQTVWWTLLSFSFAPVEPEEDQQLIVEFNQCETDEPAKEERTLKTCVTKSSSYSNEFSISEEVKAGLEGLFDETTTISYKYKAAFENTDFSSVTTTYTATCSARKHCKVFQYNIGVGELKVHTSGYKTVDVPCY